MGPEGWALKIEGPKLKKWEPRNVGPKGRNRKGGGPVGRLLLGPNVTQANPYCYLGQLLLRPMSLRPGLSTETLCVTLANFSKAKF